MHPPGDNGQDNWRARYREWLEDRPHAGTAVAMITVGVVLVVLATVLALAL